MDSHNHKHLSPDGHNSNSSNGKLPSSSFDPWPWVETVMRRWYWMVLAAVLLAAGGAYLGLQLWQAEYTATVQLIRFEAQNTTEFYKQRAFTEHTFASLLKSPELLEQVSKQSKQRVSADDLAAHVRVLAIPESDVVSISVSDKTAEKAVELANLYAAEAELFTRNMQAREAGQENDLLKQQLAEMDSDVARLNEQLQALARAPVPTAQRTSPMLDRVQAAREELAGLLAQYTEAHPKVIEHRAKIAALEKQIAEMGKDPAPSLPASAVLAPTGPTLIPTNGLAKSSSKTNAVAGTKPGAPSTSDSSRDVLLSQLQNIANSRLLLATRQREAQQFAKNPTGYCRILATASPNEVIAVDPRPKVVALAAFGGALGFGGVLILILLGELFDRRVRTVTDLKRVSRLPLLATLGNLKRMKPLEQRNWAFRTWTALQSKLSLSPNHGLVCGITSSAEGQGRSTWINLLARAATECGFRVLTIATIPSHDHQVPSHQQLKDGKPAEADENSDPSDPNMAITSSVLSSPAQVTEKLVGENSQPLVHIPLPGWVWNLERRKQWQTALNQWSKIDNIVILVELPPAAQPEAVLLAENLPNLVWLADSGSTDAADCREQLETLRNARCNLAGSVLNREPKPPLKKRFARWTGCVAFLAALPLSVAQAQETNPAPVQPVRGETNLFFSASNPAQRGAWQERFTLGAGDVLNLALFGQPDLTRLDVLIAPDGRVSYLQAQDIMAAGLTVDELRTKFDEALAQYYRTPRTIVTPVAYRSKKYYVLGKVMQRGVFTMDRPLTIIEAVARAHGLETGLLENQNSVDLADLQRSFLMRGGKRMPVNLEKLFQAGDLSQNIALEPDDYLYFAAGNLKEVYVLGEVRSPGPIYWTASSTVIGAIAARGGFTDRAYKSRVVVIRGSLDHPLTYVVDTWSTTEARSRDLALEAKDIVYVHYRPFTRVEELLDIAATAFIQSATAAWVGEYMPQIIKSPFIPHP